MNQQKTYNSVAELVETVTKAMEQDGITSEYIEQLSQTWKALDMYLSESGLAFTKEKALKKIFDPRQDLRGHRKEYQQPSGGLQVVNAFGDGSVDGQGDG